MGKDEGALAEFPVNSRIKLAGLWTSLMFCYTYGDIFSMFIPTRLQALLNGQSGAGATTPAALLGFSIMMSLPAAMIFLSLVLKPTAARRLNLAAGAFFTFVMIFIGIATIGEWMMFYTYLAAVETTLSSMVVFYAWRWERTG